MAENAARRIAIAMFGSLVAVAGCGTLNASTHPAYVRVREGSALVERRVTWAAAGAATRATEDLACPEEDLILTDLGMNGYRVEGCEAWVSYTCTRRSCALQERGEQPPVVGATTWTDEHVAAVSSRVQAELTRCSSALPATLSVRVRLSRTGRVVLRDRSLFRPEVMSCLDERLGVVALRGQVDDGRSVTLEFRDGAVVEAPAAATDDGSVEPPP